jgi:conjugal transfer pilus assembly protein TraE
MSPEQATNERTRLRADVRFHKVLNVALVSLHFLVGGALVYVLMRDTVHIVPPDVRAPYELGPNYANREYLQDMSSYILASVLTTTPELVDYNNKVILRMTDPEGYPELRASLDAAASRIKKERITTVWVPRAQQVFERAKQVRTTGVLKTYIADQLTSEREREYLVEFVINTSGRTYVSKVQEVQARVAAAASAQ